MEKTKQGKVFTPDTWLKKILLITLPFSHSLALLSTFFLLTLATSTVVCPDKLRQLSG